MTHDQWMGIIRQILPMIGGLMVALGWMTTDQMNSLVQVIMQIAGPIVTIAGVIWAAIANSKKSILQSAAQMPEVEKIVVNDKPLAESLPANVDTK